MKNRIFQGILIAFVIIAIGYMIAQRWLNPDTLFLWLVGAIGCSIWAALYFSLKRTR